MLHLLQIASGKIKSLRFWIFYDWLFLSSTILFLNLIYLQNWIFQIGLRIIKWSPEMKMFTKILTQFKQFFETNKITSTCHVLHIANVLKWLSRKFFHISFAYKMVVENIFLLHTPLDIIQECHILIKNSRCKKFFIHVSSWCF